MNNDKNEGFTEKQLKVISQIENMDLSAKYVKYLSEKGIEEPEFQMDTFMDFIKKTFNAVDV